jgi:small-conductance mechanosensitive channel
MAKQERELLRPEDATSMEEFEARCSVDQARSRAANSSWGAIGRILLSSLLTIVDIFFWFVFATTHSAGRWVWLVIALAFALIPLRLMGKVVGRGTHGSKRYMELSRLRKQWQEKAARGEIPQTTPGGIKVWRDELETEPRTS